MLVALSVLFFVLGGVACYNINFFNSQEYSTSQSSLPSFSVLRGSAICDDYTAVCLDASGCTCSVDSSTTPPTITSSSGTCSFKKDCAFKANNAYIDLAIAGIFLLFNIYMGWSHEKIAEKADVEEQTAQDYSIMVNDPDPDATDPDEWKEFFSQWGHVSYVTVAVDNGELLQLLAERKRVLRLLSFEPSEEGGERKETKSAASKSGSGEDDCLLFDAEENAKLYNALPAHKKRSAGIVQLRQRIVELDDRVQKEVEGRGRYEACKVFVVFEKETSQRRCLHQLTTGVVPAMMDSVTSIPDRFRFRGKNVLSVREAPEPTDVIWQNLEVSFKYQLIERTCAFVASVAIIAICAVLIYLMHDFDDTGGMAAIFISITNAVMPAVLKAINETEEHYTQGSKQTSLLLKLVLLRWMTTGFIVLAVRDAGTTLNANFVRKIWAVLLADAITTPILRLADPMTRFGHHYAAKRAKTQAKMNSYFEGTTCFFAERYTDMTKTAFVSLFFSAIFPQGLFITAFALLVSFWVDKYCLFRLWKQPPAMDGALASAARFQISLIFVIHCFISQNFFMGWPFDGVQVKSGGGEVSMTLDGGTPTNVKLYESVDKSGYSFFDFEEKSWYTGDQALVVKIYSILNIVALSVFGLWYFGSSCRYGFKKLFWGSYSTVGEASEDEYSFVPGIQTYVPMITHKSLGLPLLACVSSDLDLEHVPFTMKDYSSVNLTLSSALRGVDPVEKLRAFGRCKQYKSPRLLDHELDSVEVAIREIRDMEAANGRSSRQIMRSSTLESVGVIGSAKLKGKSIGGVKCPREEKVRRESRKKSSFLGLADEGMDK